MDKAARNLVMASGIGSALAWYGLGRHDLAGKLIAALGLGVVARAALDPELRTRANAIEKSIHIDAPRETVYDLWSAVENFPRFMSYVEEVRELGGDRQHWVVKGPAGTRIEWDALITERSRPEVLAWRTEPGSPVEHEGSVWFEAMDGGTRVTVLMTYRPPGGVIGHGVAALLGRDPKQEMDRDLELMKEFVETGVAPSDALALEPQRPAQTSAGEWPRRTI